MKNIAYQERATIEGQCRIGFGQAQLVRKYWDQPIDVSGKSTIHHLELSLLPTSEHSRACFLDYWNPRRFEPIGELFLLPADHAIRARSNCKAQNSIVCIMEPEGVERWFERDFAWTDSHLRKILDIADPRIRGLLFRIGEEIRSPGFAGDTLVELLAAQVVIELARYLKGIDEEKVSGGLSPWRLKLIEQRISDAVSQVALGELAELCDLSVRQLTRAFRVSRGRSIGSYIAEKRADQAKQLIASGMSIKAVAYTMGFSAPSNFTTAFVRATGETPRQYRLRVCGGTARATPRGTVTH